MTDAHAYAHDSQAKATPVLIFVSMLLALLWAKIQLDYKLVVPWWFDAPAVLGFYGLLQSAFDRWLWRWPGIRALHGVPNLNGQYEFDLTSSFDGFATKRLAKLKIHQTWNNIVVRLSTDSSTSVSVGAYVVDAPGEGIRLVYLYHNKPHGQAATSMSQHDGTTSLVFAKDVKSASGIYYTGRDRQNHGELVMRKPQP